ncbi:MAG: periplasmic protein thiol:disulfide oxidoreductase, DsbE subfamily [Chromatiaceae bacterium]|jgi:cytochrome c biogenesis protein CcmG/thiol:disulfide interchange protein DsbE|nr:periplasmic protein thiol:disulfide oxidoreductase, DsbE subfamily [Chromatiaceae bacterium]
MARSTTSYLFPLGIFLALAALLFYGLRLDPRLVPSPLVGKPAPAFELESLTEPGKSISSDILKGRMSLVNVWASWCPSCRQEHAELVRIARETDVQMIGFNWKDERPAALEMLSRFGNPYVLSVYDPENQVGIDWGVYGAPETFVVDAEGVIRHKRIGPIDRKVWQEEIVPVIEQYRPRG